MPKVGEILLEERTHRGISLSEISEHTHIRQAFLQALEEGNFETLPSVGHTKGFVISYAQYLGLDANALAAAVAQEMASEPPRGRAVFDRAKYTDKTSTDQNEIPWRIVWPLILAVIAAGALIWALSTFVFNDDGQFPIPPQITTTTESDETGDTQNNP